MMRLQPGPNHRGIRLDKFLSILLSELTRSQLQVLNRRGAVLVDGSKEKDGYRIRGGEEIDIEIPAPTPLLIEPEAIPLEVCYEDSDLAVIIKPAGLVVHPGAGNTRSTLVNALVARFADLSDSGGRERPGIVHRLDKWTSGLIIVAKNNHAHHVIAKTFENRQVKKTYLALVHGQPRMGKGHIDLKIGRDPKSRTKMLGSQHEGRIALSEYTVVERLGRFCLVEVNISTGRTHQIRVHLSAIGHPVVGDLVYGEKANRWFAKEYKDLGRYFLHASALEFRHPSTETSMKFQSELPEELRQMLELIRTNESN